MGQAGSCEARGSGVGLGWGDVGLGEVVSFEEEGLVGCAGERVGEAVAVVEGGGRPAPALAEVSPGLLRCPHLVKRYGDELYVQLLPLALKLEPLGAAGAAFDCNGGLQEVRHGHPRMPSASYRPLVKRSVGLFV